MITLDPTEVRHEQAILVDLQETQYLDGLTLVPRDPRATTALRKTLGERFGGVPTRRVAEGIWIPSRYTPLLKTLGPEVRINWTDAASRFVENRMHTQEAYPRVLQEVREIIQGGATSARERLLGTRGLEVLDDHQLVNVAAMTVKDGFGLCIFDEQGAGKTVTLIHAFDVLVAKDEVDFALIIAPKSMTPEWPRDFERFTGDQYPTVVLTGSHRAKAQALGSKPEVVITNFETAISMEAELAATLRWHRGRSILVVDESFFIKNPDAKRARSIRRLREDTGRAFVLCGTPAPNSPHDLVEQFNFVDFGITFDGVNIPDDRATALPIIRQAVEERGLFVRHLKQDVLPELKEKRFKKVIVTLEPLQAKIYNQALQNLVADLKAVDDRGFARQMMSFLEKRSALLQICSQPTSIVEGYSEIPAKLQALDGLLHELVEVQKEKVVLWSFYTASIDALMARYSRYHPVRYDGTVSDIQDRREAVRSFQDDDHSMLFVGNPAAAGAGITLHRARYAIYESFSNQAAHHLQSLDRIHRRGQRFEVEYLMILCEGTLEIAEYERLVRKELDSQRLLGDDVETPVTRQAMLEEAILSLKSLQGRHLP